MALTDNAIAYYKFDEASGNAADSVASNTLTNTNTVTYAAGKINNGTNYVRASSQYFTGPSITLPAAFSCAFWFKFTSATGLYNIFNHNSTASGAVSAVIINGALYYSNFTTSINSAALSINTWYFAVIKNNGVNGASLSINAGTPVTGTVSHASTASTFTVGARADINADFYDGMLDEMYIVGRAITGAEETTLYNGGTGIQYPFVTNTSLGFFNMV